MSKELVIDACLYNTENAHVQVCHKLACCKIPPSSFVGDVFYKLQRQPTLRQLLAQALRSLVEKAVLGKALEKRPLKGNRTTTTKQPL